MQKLQVLLDRNIQHIVVKKMFKHIITVDQFLNINVFKDHETVNMLILDKHDMDDEIYSIQRGDLDHQIGFYEKLLMDLYSKDMETNTEPKYMAFKGENFYEQNND